MAISPTTQRAEGRPSALAAPLGDGEAGLIGAGASTGFMRAANFAKNSSASDFAALSINRWPIWARRPPTIALAS